MVRAGRLKSLAQRHDVVLIAIGAQVDVSPRTQPVDPQMHCRGAAGRNPRRARRRASGHFACSCHLASGATNRLSVRTAGRPFLGATPIGLSARSEVPSAWGAPGSPRRQCRSIVDHFAQEYAMPVPPAMPAHRPGFSKSRVLRPRSLAPIAGRIARPRLQRNTP